MVRRGVRAGMLMRQRGWGWGSSVLAALLLMSLVAAPGRARAIGLPRADIVQQATCPSPRPPVQTQVATVSSGRIQVTLRPGFGALRRIRLGTAQHARIVLPGQSQGTLGNQDVDLPPDTASYSFVLVADGTAGAGQTVTSITLPLTVFDDCGAGHPWPTFVGGGASALVPPTVSIGDARTAEGDASMSPMSFTVSLSGPSAGPVTVQYTTVDGTARAPDQYVAASGTLTIPPGETRKALAVQIVGDREAEGDQAFSVVLSNPAGAALGAATGIGTIQDDDARPAAQDDRYIARFGQPLTIGARDGLLHNDVQGTATAEVISFGAGSVGGLSTSNAAGSQIGLAGDGSLRVRPDGSFDFRPPVPFSRPFTFQYRLSGPAGHSDATVTITIGDIPPVAADDAFTVVEDGPGVALDVLSNDADSDGGIKLIRAVTQPRLGTVTVIGDGAGLVYAPNANACTTLPGLTPDSFSYTLTPGASTATVSVTITCINDAPVVTTSAGQAVFNPGGGPVVVDAAATVGDVDNATLTSVSVTIMTPLDGSAELLTADTAGTSIVADYAAPRLTLTGLDTLEHYQQVIRTVAYQNKAKLPTLGARTLSFVADDGALSSAVVTRTVSVESRNRAPIADTIGPLTVKPGDTPTITLRGTDVETCELTFTIVTPPAHGKLSKIGDGKCSPGSPHADTAPIVYGGDPGYVGPDSFTYTVTDAGDPFSSPRTSAPATVSLDLVKP
jgi:hypothetical protein